MQFILKVQVHLDLTFEEATSNILHVEEAEWPQ